MAKIYDVQIQHITVHCVMACLFRSMQCVHTSMYPVQCTLYVQQRRFQGGGDAHLATPWAFQKNRRDMIYMRGKKVLNVSKMAKKVGLN